MSSSSTPTPPPPRESIIEKHGDPPVDVDYERGVLHSRIQHVINGMNDGMNNYGNQEGHVTLNVLHLPNNHKQL